MDGVTSAHINRNIALAISLYFQRPVEFPLGSTKDFSDSA
jgi:hypothetical protein